MWSCFLFYMVLMCLRTTIFVLLRFEEGERYKNTRKILETVLYTSEVLLMSLMIFITWFNKNYNE